MNRTALGLLAVGAVAGALIVTSLEDAVAAAIDKTVTIKGNSSHVHALTFRRVRGGSALSAEVCASALSADGGMGEEGCEQVADVPANIATSVNSLMDGAANVLWRQRRGLEQ